MNALVRHHQITGDMSQYYFKLYLTLQAQTRELRWRCLGFFERYLGGCSLLCMPPRPNPVCLYSNVRRVLSLEPGKRRYRLAIHTVHGVRGGYSMYVWLLTASA